MDSFDIIQQKEWAALTKAEKENIFSLAENEKEYNLIRLMLLTTAAEKNEIPILPASIYENIKHEIPTKKTYRNSLGWLSAACLTAIVLFSIYFLNKNYEAPKLVENNPGTVQQKAVPLAKNVTESYQSDSLLKNDAPPVMEIIKQPTAPKIAALNKPKAPNKSIEIKSNYSISEQPELLSLITEVY